MMKERLQQLIAELLHENGNLKIILRNMFEIGDLDEDEINKILDRITENEQIIEKLREGLR